MIYSEVVQFVQSHLTDGLVLVVGSGLSMAEGIPGMGELAAYLRASSSSLGPADHSLWAQIEGDLSAGSGLEAALLNHRPTETLKTWITERICELMIPREHEVLTAVLGGTKELRLTAFLRKVLRPANGLPILTTNYDRLVEIACEVAGWHVDTTAIGQYAGAFDPKRSSMGSCRRVVGPRGSPRLDHYHRAVVLKPHGSFDWYRNGTRPIRCSIDLSAERLMITPGLNKYRDGYDSPFDTHRELANRAIDQAARIVVVGYGFNDDHLQTHLEPRIRGGVHTLILTKAMSVTASKLATESPACICLSEASGGTGLVVTSADFQDQFPGPPIWDLGVLTKELLT